MEIFGNKRRLSTGLPACGILVVIINLIGIVVQPHSIATGGGSAKTETNARVGLVVEW